MSKTTPPPSDTDTSLLAVDVGQMTDEEVNGLRNQITKLAVEFARKKGSAATAERKREPYVKILHVKTIHK